MKAVNVRWGENAKLVGWFEWIVFDKNGNTILDETAMTKTATGTYEYEWDTTGCSRGYYYYYIYGTHGTVKFKVKAEIQLYS